MWLLKGFDERGFMFYSNRDSQKAETGTNSKAGLAFTEIVAPPGPPARPG